MSSRFFTPTSVTCSVVGVDGFRIDAAKHISAADIAGILSVVPADKFVVQEVIIGLDEPIHPQEYFRNGRVFDFAFAGVAKDALHYGDLAGLFSAGAEQRLLPPLKQYLSSPTTILSETLTSSPTEMAGLTISQLS